MTGLPKAITEAVAEFERLPGIGPKSATRVVFYLLNTPREFVENFAGTLVKLKSEVKICQTCYGVSEREICEICGDDKRKKNIICVVERAIEVMALEKVGGFEGVYHVLGGVINPLEHIGPEDLKILELIEKIKRKDGVEVIIATNPTMEGEATALYLKKKIKEANEKVAITRIGSGLPSGGNLEFADQATLESAMLGRREL